jgi:hypothetical protein
MAIKLGTKVRQIVEAPIEGVVINKTFNEQGDHFQFIVEFVDADGVAHQRAFNDDQVEEIKTSGAAK